jgi:hypothetical protein
MDPPTLDMSGIDEPQFPDNVRWLDEYCGYRDAGYSNLAAALLVSFPRPATLPWNTTRHCPMSWEPRASDPAPRIFEEWQADRDSQIFEDEYYRLRDAGYSGYDAEAGASALLESYWQNDW